MDDELVEDSDLVIPGETLVEDSDIGSTNDGHSDAPIRCLKDFTIYDLSTNKVVPIAELLSLSYSNRKFGASGLVNAWTDFDLDDDNEDEDDTESISISITSRPGERVKLSQILELSTHNYSDDTKTLDRSDLSIFMGCWLITYVQHTVKYIFGLILHGIFLIPRRQTTNHFLYPSGPNIAFYITSLYFPSRNLE
jgi:hypothetical protein